MKTYINKWMTGCVLAATVSACTLDYSPISQYSDVTEGVKQGTKKVVFKDKQAVDEQLKDLYNDLRDQESYIDKMLITESHADNAYAGAFNAEVLPFENNSLDATNSVLERDWKRYLKQIGKANKLVNYVDSVADKSLSQAQINQYKAQGMIFRSLILFDLVRFWGNIPLVMTVAPDITNENFDEVYPLYFPSQAPELDTYKQIESDLLFAVQHAPDYNKDDKTRMTKTVAKALLAKLYAEKPLRDYDKVVQYADAVTADGAKLVDDLSDLFGLSKNDAGKYTDLKMRNTSESLLEAQFPAGNTNWCYMMFGRNLLNWEENFTWEKWCTPSRDLISLYETQGDTKRFAETVVYYECGWSLYYPKTHYPFAYKCRSSQSSIIWLRYADVLLMKAEALLMRANPDLAGAAAIIDQFRQRAGLPVLDASVKGNRDALLEAYYNERRMEMAFEGTRWFDLRRWGKVESVMNGVFKKDSGRRTQMVQFTADSYLLPIPQGIIQTNANIKQNPGY